MADIFEEVEEGLREDRTTRIWNIIAPFIYILTAALIIGTGVREYIKWNSKQIQTEHAERFENALDALESENYSKAEEILLGFISEDDGYGLLSRHLLADIQLRIYGDIDAAALVMENTKANSIYGKLAILKSAYLRADELSLADLRSLLNPVIQGGGSLSVLAEELIAARLLTNGELSEAKRMYEFIGLSLYATRSLTERTHQALATINGIQTVAFNMATENMPETDDRAENAVDADNDAPDKNKIETDSTGNISPETEKDS